MVTVTTEYADGQFHVVLQYSSGFKYVGEDFAAGQQVEGVYEGERKAKRDLVDWRAKLTQAGLKVE